MIDITVKDNLRAAFEKMGATAEQMRLAMDRSAKELAAAIAAGEPMGIKPVPMMPRRPFLKDGDFMKANEGPKEEPRWSVSEGVAWADRIATSVSGDWMRIWLSVTSPDVRGGFAVAHGLPVTPAAAALSITSGGEMDFLEPQFDEKNVYLVASAAGVMAKVELVFSIRDYEAMSYLAELKSLQERGLRIREPEIAEAEKPRESSRLAATKRKFRRL